VVDYHIAIERGEQNETKQNKKSDSKTNLSGFSFQLLGTTKLKSFGDQWVGC